MKKQLLVFLPLLFVLAGMFVSCEEVVEVGKYDNWKKRNEAFIDSLKALKPQYVGTEEAALAIPVGTLFAIQVEITSLQNNPQYVYCKKITANTTGQRPIYTQSVTAYYYGTLITGDKFDGNFKGYSALDKTFSGENNPTEFDSTSTFALTRVIPGWTTVLQYMRTGERWMVYIPYQSAYGTSDSGSIPGHSTLAFDIQLEKVL